MAQPEGSRPCREARRRWPSARILRFAYRYSGKSPDQGALEIKAVGEFGGAKRDRTADLLHAMQALSQLSYGPTPGFTGTVSGEVIGSARRRPDVGGF